MDRYHYTPRCPDYPRRLGDHPSPPPFTASGPITDVRAVAIVGSRGAVGEALEFARQLATTLATAGFTVVSGGAKGIDTAAHRGALDAGGSTWVVCPNGAGVTVPQENEGLFEEIRTSPTGRLIWPFPDGTDASNERFLERNGILVALSEAVVVIQASFISGSRNAATWARDLKRPVWMPAAPPWGIWAKKFSGTLDSLESGDAKILTSEAALLHSLGVEPPKPVRKVAGTTPQLSLKPALQPPRDGSWTEDEIAVFTATSIAPLHRDEVASEAALPIGRAITALLTLSMKDVVVEGPAGFYRRKCGG